MKETEKYWEEHIVKSPKRYNNFVSCLERIPSRRKVAEMVQKFNKILDVACGVGLEYELYGDRYFGIDITKSFLYEAKKKYKDIRLCNARIQELPFKYKSFDVVICRAIFEHLPEIETPIQEISRLTDTIIITWFLPPADDEKLDVVNKKTGGTFHNNVYSVNRVMKCLKDNDLKLTSKIDVETDQIWYVER